MDLKERVLEGELMDAPDLEAGLHHQALQGLHRVNRLSGTARIISQAILQAVKTTQTATQAATRATTQTAESVARNGPSTPPWRILDLACGGGDVTLEVSRQLCRAGVAVQIEAWDRSGTAIAFAQEQADRISQATGQTTIGQVQFHQHDAFDLNADRQFDVVMCTLFLHHLDGEAATELLDRMYRASTRLVLVDDLRRTWLGYRLAQLGCYVLTRSPIVHVDGPLSVRAAFTEGEVQAMSQQVGLPLPDVRRHWPQRFLMSWRHST